MVPEVVERKARAIGATHWLEALPQLVRELAARWELTLGAVFDGGTEALVQAAPRRRPGSRRAAVGAARPAVVGPRAPALGALRDPRRHRRPDLAPRGRPRAPERRREGRRPH